MRRKQSYHKKRPFLPTFLLLILLAACSGPAANAPASPSPMPSATSIPPTNEPTPTATETAVPPTSTATSIPPTATAAPTETAVPPTHTPAPIIVPTLESAPPSVATTVETLVVELPSATGGLSIDGVGNIYVGDMGLAPARLGETVWQVTPDGDFSVYAEGQGLLGASGNLMLPNGTLYQSSFTGGTVSQITSDGTVTEIASEGLTGPVGITADEANNLYIADCRGRGVDKISPDGVVTPFASGGLFSCPNGITRDPAGYFYVLNFRGGNLLRISPDGLVVEEFATFPGHNGGHVIYGNGQLYVVARGANQIYTVSLAGEVTLLAGSGARGNEDGPALESSFNLLNDIVLSPDGKRLYVNQAADLSGNNIPSTIRIVHLE